MGMREQNEDRGPQYEGEEMIFFINLWSAAPSSTFCGGGLQRRAVTACLLAFLLSNLCMTAGCGSSSSSFMCFPSSMQTVRHPSANIYAQTDDLGINFSNIRTDDPQEVDQATAADCVG